MDRVVGVVPDVIDPQLETWEREIVKPLSRRQFKRRTGWDFQRLLDYENLAILCVPDYARTIFSLDAQGRIACDSRGRAVKNPLTHYHQWVLRQIRSLFARGLKDLAVEQRLDCCPDKYTFVTYLEFLSAQNKISRKRQQRRYYEQPEKWQAFA